MPLLNNRDLSEIVLQNVKTNTSYGQLRMHTDSLMFHFIRRNNNVSDTISLSSSARTSKTKYTNFLGDLIKN